MYEKLTAVDVLDQPLVVRIFVFHLSSAMSALHRVKLAGASLSNHLLNSIPILTKPSLILNSLPNAFGVKFSSTQKKDHSIARLKVAIASAHLFISFLNLFTSYILR